MVVSWDRRYVSGAVFAPAVSSSDAKLPPPAGDMRLDRQPLSVAVVAAALPACLPACLQQKPVRLDVYGHASMVEQGTSAPVGR